MVRLDSPTLDEIREKLGPRTAAERLPPSAAELAELRKVIPGIAIESDRIVVPLQAALGHVDMFRLGMWVVILCSLGAIALSALLATLRPHLSWFVIHSAWLLPLLLFEAHRRRRRWSLTIFPSSPIFRVRKGGLAVDFTYDGQLFQMFVDWLGLEVQVRKFFPEEQKGSEEQRLEAVRILNRYVLFGTRTSEPAELREAFLLPAPLAVAILDDFDTAELHRDRLVLRVVPYGGLNALSGSLFGGWFFVLGPLLCALAPGLTRLSHGVLLALAAFAALVHRSNRRPPSLILLAARRTVVIRKRNGAEQAVVLDSNPFRREGDGETGSLLVFIRPSPNETWRDQYLLVSTGGFAFLDHQIDHLCQYLGLPPRPDRERPSLRTTALPPPPQQGWKWED